MKKFSKGSQKSESSAKMGQAKCEMTQPGSGSMDALEVTDAFASADGSKLKKGAYKFDRYK
jgi:hypothetical protein